MTAVITGATKGIGKSIAERFAQAGFDLFICARSQADLTVVKNEWEKKYKVKVFTKVADLARKNEVILFSEFIKANTKTVQVLVNNAGQYIPGSLFENSADKLADQLNVNLMSVHYLTAGLIPLFREQKKGHIFTLGSTLSTYIRNEAAFYTISKHAVRTWHQLLFEQTREWGVKSTLIIPSATVSASWDGADVNHADMIQPENIAEVIYDCYNMGGAAVVSEITVKTLNKDFD